MGQTQCGVVSASRGTTARPTPYPRAGPPRRGESGTSLGRPTRGDEGHRDGPGATTPTARRRGAGAAGTPHGLPSRRAEVPSGRWTGGIVVVKPTRRQDTSSTPPIRHVRVVLRLQLSTIVTPSRRRPPPDEQFSPERMLPDCARADLDPSHMASGEQSALSTSRTFTEIHLRGRLDADPRFERSHSTTSAKVLRASKPPGSWHRAAHAYPPRGPVCYVAWASPGAVRRCLPSPGHGQCVAVERFPRHRAHRRARGVREVHGPRHVARGGDPPGHHGATVAVLLALHGPGPGRLVRVSAAGPPGVAQAAHLGRPAPSGGRLRPLRTVLRSCGPDLHPRTRWTSWSRRPSPLD